MNTFALVMDAKAQFEQDTGQIARHIFVSPKDQAALMSEGMALWNAPARIDRDFKPGKFGVTESKRGDTTWWWDAHLPEGTFRFASSLTEQPKATPLREGSR